MRSAYVLVGDVILVGVPFDRFLVGHEQRAQVLLVLPHDDSGIDVLALGDPLLDGKRLDVLTAEQDDRVLRPTRDLELTAVSEHSQVAGVEPAVIESSTAAVASGRL